MNLRKKKRVVVVNDEPVQLKLISAILEEDGFQVHPSASVEEALAVMAEQGPPDAVVTDLHMPGIDGWRFCRLLKSAEYPLFNKIPILVVSATFAGEHARQITSELGANAFLPMPFEPALLSSYVQAVTKGDVSPSSTGVLIIEDSRTQSTLLKRSFTEHGYTVYAALKGEEGQRLFREHLPEIVILDYHLPDIQGDKLLEEFKRSDSLSVVIMVTTDPTPELATRFMRMGADGYVRKPFDTGYLITLCESARRERALLRVEDLLEERTRQLWQSESRYRLLFDKMLNGFALHEIICDDDGKPVDFMFLDVNPAFEKIVGLQKEKLVGKNASGVFPELEADWIAIYGEVALSGRPAHFEKYHKCLGKNFEVLAFSPERSQFGVTINDITERIKTEERRSALERQLFQTQKLDAIGQLAGGLAHDFNNLLTSILGYANLLQVRSETGSFVHDAAKTIESAAEKASELTRQLLGFARKGKNQNTSVDLNSIIRDVISLLSRTFGKNISIKKNLRAEGSITGDPTQMQQVILNLAVNARDAMPYGGVLLFETETKFVNEEVCRKEGDISPGHYIVVSVIDTGCGIPEEQIDRVLEPFFTTKEQGKGTGMGLAMVYGIVKNHGGSIMIESEVGKGSKFRLFFPTSPDRSRTVETVKQEGPARGSGHILLVDDEVFVRGIATEMLRFLGYKVATAENGKEAVDYYGKFADQVDLVVLDMVMPEMNGHECFLELKKINPDVKAILSTGYGLNGKAQEIIDEGVSGFITKPYHLREFSEVVKNALNS